MSTADERREQARGNGVGQAGQFGHQHHSAPAAFDAGDAVPNLASVATPRVWAGATYYNDHGTVIGAGEESELNPKHTREILDAWPLEHLEELRDEPGAEADEQLARAYVDRGFASWPIGKHCSVGATPDSAALTTYIAARRADEERRGADAVQADRVAASVQHASAQLARQAGRYQVQVGATAAFIASQVHPDAKEVLVGTNDMTGEYALVGVRNRDGAVSTDWVDGDGALESCLQEMPWDGPEWLTYIEDDGDDSALRDEHGAAYLLDISQVHQAANARLNELDNHA